MLKNLLYLYNDGHNPFPNMKGYGGLGYHLPQYRKVIHGSGPKVKTPDKRTLDEVNEENSELIENMEQHYSGVEEHKGSDNEDESEEEEEEEDEEEEEEEEEEITEIQKIINENDFSEEDIDKLMFDLQNDKAFNKGNNQISKTQFKTTYLGGRLEPIMDILKTKKKDEVIKIVAELQKPKTIKPQTTAEELTPIINQVDDLIKSEGETEEEDEETDEIYNIFKKHYNDRMLKAIGKDLKQLIEETSEGNQNYDVYNNLYTQYKEFNKNRYNKIENIKEYINSKEELNEFEQLLKDSIDTNEQEIDELMSGNPDLTYDEKIDILKNHEFTIIELSKESYEDNPEVKKKKVEFYKKYEGIKNIDDAWSKEIAGKPYEHYFLTVGNPIIKYIADDENIDVTEDLGSNPLVKADGGEDTCFIDLFSYNSEKNIGYLNEMKDFKINMTDEEYNPNDKNTYVSIQLTKLTGTSYFVKDAKGNMIIDKNGDGIEKAGYELLFYEDGGKYFPYYIKYKDDIITMNPDNDEILDIKQYNILSSSNVGTVKADLISLINDKKFRKINGIQIEQVDELFKISFNHETHPNRDKLYKDEVLTVRIPKNKFRKWNE